jgi:hypothetical protein
MRKEGIRRRNKPWPTASDIHYPLCDTVIEKMKPFYINQLFATERLADFTAKKSQLGEEVIQCAWWFDYKLKQKSNLEDEIILAIDAMLVYGRGIVKVTWCPEGKGYDKGGYLDYDAIEPLYLIVPQESSDLQDSDRIVHVKHLTPWAYKHGPDSKHYNQDKDFVKRITGMGREQDDQLGIKDQIKQLSEGITHSKSEIIILWEVYEKHNDDGWRIHTCSPLIPSEDVRQPLKMPYKHGYAPFVELTMERAEKGYYSQRGVCEILKDFESSMCKMWNEKHDAMTLYNRPVFTSERDMPNTGNIQLRPGQILPFMVRALQSGAPPISWDQEMQNTRIVAEERISVPDFGLGNREFDNKSDSATATEIQATMSQSQQIVNMRSRIFRRQLAQLFCQSWELLKQYDEDFDFIRGGKSYTMDKGMREEVMSISPNGSADSWNLHTSLQKAVNLFMMLKGSPFIKPGELEKIIVEKTEAGLADRLIQDPMVTESQQAEKQMLEMPALEDGFPISPKPDDRHDLHAGVLAQYMFKNVTQGQQGKPEGMNMIKQHFGQHMEAWMQADKKGATKFMKEFQQNMALAMGIPPKGQGKQQLPMRP